MNDFDWKNLIDPLFYIHFDINGIKLGVYIVLFIVFAETGLFAGFFLPGDSLLFLAGIYSRELIENILIIDNDFVNVILLATLVALSGILGNIVGYWFGSKSGYYLYNKEDSFWFKKKYLVQSKDFFEKYGGKAIIFARFLPIFRTFAPIVAGIVSMERKKFMFYNILSSFIWSYTLIFAGHYLYGFLLDNYQIDLKQHIELIVLILVGITILPVIYKFGKKTKEEV
ncbi:MAG TPA: VTT domain-containing protein [Flavobacterium sp.]|jgi:membrane-associated protein|uniref:DedA family protein n=1 Tax=Flavobacterium sp. TaxID=239 RepID=UPI001B45B515|nr:VTT domain-containing protein [Flavobacterium sp.]MBP6146484.1 VTT domain-containing protein [Flavobacterium sp.]MBP7182656.1 VTT domain-containing protein [Flavobacterium sp.]MBP7317531.1 VTT domain-containing protein [Flavobacterium sp.]MBP8886091.1 VTT domain-containing protein [Flavobacterium sp.]HRL70643.1 VTT domain-containing protein [Flavobacterium sp.]